MKILLLYKSGRPGAGDYFARMMPVGLGWINATLRDAGYDATLANLSRRTWADAESLLRRERPDLVGITLYTFNRHPGLRLASLAKKVNPRCTVIAGGPHATHMAASILERYVEVDAVGLGEGEATMLDVAGAVSGARPLAGVAGLMVRGADGAPVATRPRTVIADLDTLPFPGAHYQGHYLDPQAEASFIITSRGCPARCTFCNTPDFWGTRMRFRGPGHMIEEIRCLKERHGIVYVSIRDDTFTVHKQRVIEFCRRLIDERLDIMWNCQSRVNAIDEERLAWMRRAGCDHIQYGIESGSPRLLKRLAKDITPAEIRQAAKATRRVGLTLSIYLISGVPGETDEDFEATRRLLEEIQPHDGIVAPLAVFPGTWIHDEMIGSGELDAGYWVRERKDTLYLMTGAPARRSFKRLTALCARTGAAAVYTRAQLEEHKRLLPDAFAAWIASGLAYEAADDAGAAMGEYEAIERFSPGNLWARMHIGRLLLETGDRPGARLYLREALRSAPRSGAVRSLLAAAGDRSARVEAGA